jgi:hypothetical protein
MTIEMARPVLVDDELVTLDRDYLTVYGNDPSTWSRGVRGEYLALSDAASKRTMYREHLPQHPRKSSAGTRRHHLKYLPYRIERIVPGAATILLTPVWTDLNSNETGRLDISFMALVRDREGLPMKLPAGGSQRLAALLQGAFTANWSRCQTWRADGNTLTEFTSTQRDFEESRAAGYVESLAEYEARLNAKAGAQ